jgi:ABC-type antimicrobial peptide transport system permease subunit
VYVAHVQEAELGRWKTLVVRTAGPVELRQPMHAAIDSLGREYLLYSRTLAYQLALNHKESVLAGRVAAAFGVMALIIAGLGVFGCLAFAVSTRTREIAVRLALGAAPGVLLRFVGKQVAIVCGAGALIGAAGAVSGQRVVQALLWDGAPTDATSTLIAIALLSLTAAAAATIPAVRVLKLDPARTLRDS